MHRLPFIAVLSMLAASIASSFVETLAVAAPPTLTLPESISGEPGAFIVVRAESDSPWVNFKADSGLAVFPANLLADRKATVVTARSAGRYVLHAYTGNVDGGADADVTIVVGDAPPVPVPTPPQPVPPKPEPTPPPVVSGKRELMIVRETADTTPDFARTITALQGKGAAYDYLRSKGHRIAILDDQSPASVRQAWRPHFDGMTLPALVILDAETRNLLYKGPLSPTASADSIIAKLKEYGG